MSTTENIRPDSGDDRALRTLNQMLIRLLMIEIVYLAVVCLVLVAAWALSDALAYFEAIGLPHQESTVVFALCAPLLVGFLLNLAGAFGSLFLLGQRQDGPLAFRGLFGHTMNFVVVAACGPPCLIFLFIWAFGELL